jgi:hypothetical protein
MLFLQNLIMRKKTYEVPLELLSIKDEGYHLFIKMKVNRKEVRMLLDTGASRTVFDVSSLKAIHDKVEMEANEDPATGLGSNTVENFVAFLDVINIGGLKIRNYQFGALDLSHVNESYSRIDAAPIAGVFGSDLLYMCKAIINYKDMMVTLEKPKS